MQEVGLFGFGGGRGGGRGDAHEDCDIRTTSTSCLFSFNPPGAENRRRGERDRERIVVREQASREAVDLSAFVFALFGPGFR